MFKTGKFVLAATAVATLVACGGGGTATPVKSSLVGTAATGAALANASVSVTNTAGLSPCIEATITTTELGSYTCTLNAGELAPFFIVVTDPTGNTKPLVSIATTTPAAGTPLLVNATPLTTAIVAQLNNGDALGVVANNSLYDLATFTQVKNNVIAQIQAVVTSIDPQITNYDPFTTSITAATAGSSGNTADQVLDVIKISTTASGALALSTITDTTPIPLAAATTANVESVAAPTTNVSDLTKSAQLFANAFANCYALPVSKRVTLDSDLNITEIAAVCRSMFTTANNPTTAPNFKSNGYTVEQSFYNVLTSEIMTGAKFSVPEIMLFFSRDASDTLSRDRAVLNVKYIDNAGNPGNFITVAQNYPNSSTTSRPSNWWITGNQSNYDISIATNSRRTQEYYPNSPSRFQGGINISINGRRGAPNADSFDSALVTGTGLPSTGLWYVRSSSSNNLVLSKVRSDLAQPTVDLVQECPACNNFWMSRTVGIAGENATKLKDNPMNAQWAGSNDGSYNGVSGVRPTKSSQYTIKLYNNATLVATETRTLLSDLVATTQMVNLQWNDIGKNTAAAIDINNSDLNGTLKSVIVDWIQNPSAEKIRNIWVSQTDGGYDNITRFSLNTTNVVAMPRGDNVLYTSMVGTRTTSEPFGGYREIGFSYRMLDGSIKQAVYTYYP